MKTELTEAEFTRQVIQFFNLHGWYVAHFRPGMNRRGQWSTAVQGQGKGFPDIIAVKNRVIVAELKVWKGKPTPEQTDWLQRFEAAGIPAYVWRETDWPEIESVVSN